MERIKQALDKARAERNASGVSSGKNQEKNENPQHGLAVEATIQYTQTKIHRVDAQTLKRNRIIFDESDRVGLAAYKMLRTQVLQRMTARNWNTLGITSPAPGEGKTITAINLAISLARELHHTVLLVDTDLRNPSIARCFGIEAKFGIGDYLIHGMPLEEIFVNPGIERLVVLPGSRLPENSSEILASNAMKSMVDELKHRYPRRLILFDLPPILSADDALSFVSSVDTFLVVLRDGKTTRNELEQSMEIMKDATIIGTVLNDARETISAYY